MKNVVITEYFTGFYDAQRSAVNDNLHITNIVKNLYRSIVRFNVELDTLVNFKNKDKFPPLLKVVYSQLFEEYPTKKLYFQRWEAVYDYLLQHPEIYKVALVDIGDVEMLNYPFDDIQDGILYIGDEINDLQSFIVASDSKPKYMENFLYKNHYLQLLNAGVLVGTRQILLEFLGIFIKLFTDDAVNVALKRGGQHLGNFEMALMNYVAYKFFNNRLCHGRKVTTKFLYCDRSSKAWFKHK